MDNDGSKIAGRKPASEPVATAPAAPSPGRRPLQPRPRPTGQRPAMPARKRPGTDVPAGRPDAPSKAPQAARPPHSQRAFAIQQAQDGVDQGVAAEQAEEARRHYATLARSATGDDADRVARLATMEGVVLPAPKAPPAGIKEAAAFLATSALVQGNTVPAVAAATDAPTAPIMFTPAMLRHCKNELGLRPAAMKMLVAANAQAAAVPTVASEPRPVWQKYLGYMNWGAFSALVSRDQLRATLELMLLRLIDIAKQNENQTKAAEVDVLRTQTQIEFERLSVVAQLSGASMSLVAQFAEGSSRMLRNKNMNLSSFESEMGIKLETNDKASHLRAKLIDVAQQAIAEQHRAHGPIAGRARIDGQILTFVPKTSTAPEMVLTRHELAPCERDGLKGSSLYTSYQNLNKEHVHAEEMDGSGKFVRLSQAALALEQAAAQTQQAAREAQNPQLAQRYQALAQGYGLRASQLRDAAASCGYLSAVSAAHRANAKQIFDDMNIEARDLEKVVAQRQKLVDAAPASNAAAPAKEEHARKISAADAAIEDRQNRLIGMRLALSAVENFEAHPKLAIRPSGTQALVTRVEACMDAVAQTRLSASALARAQLGQGAAPDLQAQRAQGHQDLLAFSRLHNADVVRANLLSHLFHRAGAERYHAQRQNLAAIGDSNEHPDVRAAARQAVLAAADNHPDVGPALERLQGGADGEAKARALGQIRYALTDANVRDAHATLANPNATHQEHEAAAQTLRAALLALQPELGPGALADGYLAMANNTSRLRMRKHVEQHGSWERPLLGRTNMLQAERRFWSITPDVTASPVAEAGLLRRALRHISPLPRQDVHPHARFGSADEAGGAASPIAKFMAGEGVNMLDPAARARFIASHVQDAKVWCANYQDPSFNKMSEINQYLSKLQAWVAPFANSEVHGMAEGAVGDLSGLIDAQRDEYYGAMAQELGQTLGLTDTLRQLMNVPRG